MTINFSIDGKYYEFNWNCDAYNCIKNIYSGTSKRTLTTQKLYEIVSSFNKEETYLFIFSSSNALNYIYETIKILILCVSNRSIDNEICDIIKIFIQNPNNILNVQTYTYIDNIILYFSNLINYDITIINIIKLINGIDISLYIKILMNLVCFSKKFGKIESRMFCDVLKNSNQNYRYRLVKSFIINKYIIIESFNDIKNILNFIDFYDHKIEIKKLIYKNMSCREKIKLCNNSDNINDELKYIFEHINCDILIILYKNLVNHKHKIELIKIILSKNPNLDEIIFYQLIQKLNFYDSFRLYKYYVNKHGINNLYFLNNIAKSDREKIKCLEFLNNKYNNILINSNLFETESGRISAIKYIVNEDRQIDKNFIYDNLKWYI